MSFDEWLGTGFKSQPIRRQQRSNVRQSGSHRLFTEERRQLGEQHDGSIARGTRGHRAGHHRAPAAAWVHQVHTNLGLGERNNAKRDARQIAHTPLKQRGGGGHRSVDSARGVQQQSRPVRKSFQCALGGEVEARVLVDLLKHYGSPVGTKRPESAIAQ